MRGSTSIAKSEGGLSLLKRTETDYWPKYAKPSIDQEITNHKRVCAIACLMTTKGLYRVFLFSHNITIAKEP